MSYSSLWLMDKDYNGFEDIEFGNSWLFSPIVWDILFEKYMPYANRTFNEQKKGFMSAAMFNKNINTRLNKKLNASSEQADRVLWELTGQQIFFTKDKQFIASQIHRFLTINSDCEELKEHIKKRFNEVANSILAIDEQRYPHFVFKNTSCDDNVEYWFSHYNEKTDEYEEQPLSRVEKYVTEFVSIENGKIEKFTGNLDYFNGGIKMLTNKKYDKYKSVEVQDSYCEENGKIRFAPFTGTCYGCHRNIYEPQGWKRDHGRNVPVPANSAEADYITGITTKEAGSELVTGCPHCHLTFCD